jgi:hypothetical protein
MVRRIQLGLVSQPIGRWSTGGSADRIKKAVIKEIRQKESTVEAGQSTIVNGSKSQFLGNFDSCKSHFLFLVVFVFL